MRVKAEATEKDTQDSNLAVPAKRSSANFIGKLMNLVTIDLENLMAGREFFQFCECIHGCRSGETYRSLFQFGLHLSR